MGGYADVTAEDESLMSERTRRRYLVAGVSCSYTASAERVQRAGPLRGLIVAGCAALRGSVLYRVSCAIYEVRPSVCREFEPGGRACLARRRWLQEESDRIRSEDVAAT